MGVRPLLAVAEPVILYSCMVTVFKRSRIAAFYIGIPLTVITFIIVWTASAGRVTDPAMHFLVSFSLALFVFGTVFLVSRAMAMRDYQKLLPPFYADLDPQTMVGNLENLNEKGLNADEKAANDLHKAGGYIYLGETDKARSLLEGINIPPHDLNTLFLIRGNLATCALMAGDMHEAKKRIEQLEAIVKDKRCNQNLATRVGRVSGYLRMCRDICKGKDVDISIMTEDFETSPVPTHKLDVAYYIARYMLSRGDEEGAAEYVGYVTEHGAKTVYPELLEHK